MRRNKKRGFSVVEMLVVVTILGLLFSGVVAIAPRFLGEDEAARRTAAAWEHLEISRACAMYAWFFGSFPKNMDALRQSGMLVGDGNSPWKNPYELELTRDGKVLLRTKDIHGNELFAPFGDAAGR
jgi:prepilin-type N-terminal cleavage/methylation domain-containing protein